MRCPICPEVTLVMAERQGIEIDYCPNCRGVWLDRGELDKLIEKSAPAAHEEFKKSSIDNRDRAFHKDYFYKKKKSFLSDIFD